MYSSYNAILPPNQINQNIMKLEMKHISPYLITRYGQVINRKTNIECKQFLDKYGYKRVNILNKQFLVHRLVAFIYIDNPKNKPQVNHIDGDKTNNNASNLEWVTNQENRNHAVKNGLHKHQEYKVYDLKGVFIGLFKSSTEVSEKLGLDQSAVSKVANGYYKSTKGYKICKVN